MVLTASFLAVGCGDQPVPQGAAHDHGEAGHTHGPAEPIDAYDSIVASIEAHGDSGARAAWAAGHPTLLLFAASW